MFVCNTHAHTHTHYDVVKYRCYTYTSWAVQAGDWPDTNWDNTKTEARAKTNFIIYSGKKNKEK